MSNAARPQSDNLRSGGRILVDQLRIHGVERAFCVPGESYLAVLDAFVDVPESHVPPYFTIVLVHGQGRRP